MDKALRKSLETKIYNTFSRLDPTGANTEYYKARFAKMSDKDFEAFMTDLAENEDHYLILTTVEFENECKLEYIEDAAKYLGVPLYERVVMPNYSPDPSHPIVTKYEVPVIYLPVKRMQQMANKKNGTSIEISQRDKFNQVVGHDKNGRSSDMENYGLVVLQADEILKEFLGPRADDSVQKSEMYGDIAEKGYCSLGALTNDLQNKTTLNYIDSCFLAMGLKSDLVTKGNILKQGMK